MTTDEELDARFGAADRAVRLSTHESALVDLLAVSEHKSLRRRRRRSLARAGIGAALIVGLGLGAPTAAAAIREYLAQSGTYCSGTECGNDPTQEEAEWIDSGAPDFARYVDSLFPSDLPLADGTSREDIVGQLVGGIEAQNAVDAQDGLGAGSFARLGLSSSLEFIIYCGWVNQWVAADDAGDADSARRAAEVMRDAAEWPDIVKVDGGGVVTSILTYADAADRGDAAMVFVGSQAFGCMPVESDAP